MFGGVALFRFREKDFDNLYVVDARLNPHRAALNPTHTLLANALRVSDHLLERLQIF